MRLASSRHEPPEPERDIFEDTPWRLIRHLGDGGMGEVFLVEHRNHGRRCVAKVQHARLANDESIAERMRLEIQALGRLDHPHVVSVLDRGTLRDGRLFCVMEYLRGSTLADELAKRGQLPVLEALTYTCQLLQALDAAHSLGIVHRDIKPENLFIHEADGRRALKLLDFGVARVMPDAPPEAPKPIAVPTETGIVVGTPRYVSPEGAMGQRVDRRADLYAVALVLYRMLAGRGPFDHIRSAALLLAAHAAEDPAPPSELSREPVPPELDRAVLRALKKSADERFQSANELRAELEKVIGLLNRPPGWAETSAFDLEQHANAPRGDLRATERVRERDTAIRSSSSVPDASSGPAQEPAQPTELETGRLELEESTLSRGTLVLAFMAALIFTSALAAGTVALLRGGP